MSILLPPTDGAELRAARPAQLPPADDRPGARAREKSSSEPSKAGRQPILVSLADVRMEPLRPLWNGYLYRGKLHLVEGDPGLGKSTALLDLAARLSTGNPMPDGSPVVARVGVVILSAEDGLADTIKPRLEAAGADPSRIFAMSGVSDRPGDLPGLPSDLDAFEAAIVQSQAALAVVDPLMAYLDPQVNSWRDQDVRRALGALMEVAERTGCAIVCVRHLNKSTGTQAVYRGGGSIGLVGAARVALLVAADPDDEQRRVLATVKNNLSPHASSLAFRLVPDEATGAARIEWLGASTHHASSLLAVPTEPEERSAIDEGVAVLEEILAAGPVRATIAKRAALDAGIRAATLQRAKKSAGVETRRVGGAGKDGWWEWQLPTKACTPALRRSTPADEWLRPDESVLAAVKTGGLPSSPMCTRCRQPADERDLITVGGNWKHRNPAACHLDAASTSLSEQEPEAS